MLEKIHIVLATLHTSSDEIICTSLSLEVVFVSSSTLISSTNSSISSNASDESSVSSFDFTFKLTYFAKQMISNDFLMVETLAIKFRRAFNMEIKMADFYLSKRTKSLNLGLNCRCCEFSQLIFSNTYQNF